jgi:cellobiose phosphorylase
MAFAALGNREKVWELFSMIQPLNHAKDAADTQVYKVEPYVMAADVYANESHKGRGGWTWYTGSAGWMYQFIIGSLLGLELEKDSLKFKPCFPLEWPSVSIKYRYGKSSYNITVFQLNSDEESWWKENENTGKGDTIKLVDDGTEHTVAIHIRNEKNSVRNDKQASYS